MKQSHLLQLTIFVAAILVMFCVVLVVVEATLFATLVARYSPEAYSQSSYSFIFFVPWVIAPSLLFFGDFNLRQYEDNARGLMIFLGGILLVLAPLLLALASWESPSLEDDLSWLHIPVMVTVGSFLTSSACTVTLYALFVQIRRCAETIVSLSRTDAQIGGKE